MKPRIHVFSQWVLAVGITLACLTASVIAWQAGGNSDPDAAKIENPVAATPESIAAGQKAYQSFCAGCHGVDGKGGLVISVIEDRGGNQPPDLTDDKWDHGSSDGEIFVVTKKGVPPDYFMAPWDGRITDTEIWNVVNYIKSLAPKKKGEVTLHPSPFKSSPVPPRRAAGSSSTSSGRSRRLPSA